MIIFSVSVSALLFKFYSILDYTPFSWKKSIQMKAQTVTPVKFSAALRISPFFFFLISDDALPKKGGDKNGTETSRQDTPKESKQSKEHMDSQDDKEHKKQKDSKEKKEPRSDSAGSVLPSKRHMESETKGTSIVTAVPHALAQIRFAPGHACAPGSDGTHGSCEHGVW